MHGSRIRYDKYTEEELRSHRSFDGITVYLYPSRSIFQLVTDRGVLFEGNVTAGLHKLKKAAKLALENQGVVFNSETRKPRK